MRCGPVTAGNALTVEQEELHANSRHHSARRHADAGQRGSRPAAAASGSSTTSSRNGVHGIFVLGTNSEFYALDEREKQEVIATAVAHVNKRVPVYAGTGAETTREAVRLTQMAETEGADGVSVITPYFVSPTQQEIFDHYRRIAESTSLPVILYNNPSTCGGVKIDVETVARLAEIPNILGIKDSSGDLQNTNEFIRARAGALRRAAWAATRSSTRPCSSARAAPCRRRRNIAPALLV